MFITDKTLLHMPYICVLSITVLLTYKVWHNYAQRGKLPLPPCPPGIPILGNLIEFVKDAKKASQHLLLQRWAEKYGDIIGVKIGPMIEYYLSSDRAVKEIFDRASAATAERPRWIVSNEQICNKMNVLLLNAKTGLAQILGTLPGAYMVDVLPFLDSLPMLFKPWERNARARFRRDLEWCMERLNSGDPEIPQEGFLQTLLQDSNKFGVEPEEAAYLSLMVVMAAADTSQMSTWSFLEAMLQFPDVQKKAQKEIDDVVGDRIPVFEDLDSIPYVRCIMKEVWRWRPPVALGHPHVTTKELEYGGYRIPKGSRIHINAWAIGHDANRHEDPERFWPERYSHDKTTTMESINSTDVTRRDHFAFGSGRRVCPGYHVAERSLGVSIMRILWAFDIQPSPTAKLPLDYSQYRGQPPGNPNSDLPVSLLPRNGKDGLIRKAFDEATRDRAPMAQLST
ncbi:cytochrome P450 [Penicillium pulvis]|uniref:cytochrome P450 n=1 Tax=Penicillium pulvis TaxID=1562058 RepID=UPI00254950D9|nr:cytochrome P450 [Penicillium pulvis]KAJ5810401.1 cytochrome P450 [Penicillium pulvis]